MILSLFKKRSERNFSHKSLRHKIYEGQNLKGFNFKEADLCYADFTNAYLQGADFTKAKLTGAKFDNAEAGLQKYQEILLVIISFIVAALLVVLLVIIGQRIGDRLLYRDVSGIYPENNWSIIWNTVIILSMFAVFFLKILQKEPLKYVFFWTGGIGASAIIFTILHALIQVINGSASLAHSVRPISEATVGFFGVMGIGIIAVAIGLSIDIGKFVYGDKTINLVKYGIFIIVIPVVLVMQSASGASYDSLTVIMFIALNGLFLGVYIAKQYSTNNQSFIRSTTVLLAAMSGTSFRYADLEDASFIGAKVKSTDFRDANLERCNVVSDLKNYDLACFEEFDFPSFSEKEEKKEEERKPIKKRWAFIVGVNEYDNTRSLSGAANDALKLKEKLEEFSYDVFWLTDNNSFKNGYLPTCENVKDELTKYCQLMDKDDLFLVYFACHGEVSKKDNSRYLFLKDTDSKTLKNSGLALDTVKNIMEKGSKAERLVLILDACYMGEDNARNTEKKEDFLEYIHTFNKGFAIIAASTSQQEAYEYDLDFDGKQGGIFTHFLLKALSGEADYNKNNFVTAFDIERYISSQIYKHREEKQTIQKPKIQNPTIMIRRGTGDIPIVENYQL